MNHPHHSHTAPENHAGHGFAISNTLTNIAIGTAIAGAAIMLAPHVLPAMGIGSAAMAEESMFVLHTSAEAGGSGLAGLINGMLGSIPVIGSSLASGGFFNAAASGAVGIGGVLLGNYIERKEGVAKSVKWGSLIKYAALATSALIALPTVLTAIGSGLIYLSTLTGNASFTSSVVGFVSNTLGTMGGAGAAMLGFSGMAAIIPHMLTCGVSVLPAALAYNLPSDTVMHEAGKYTDGSINVALEIDQPVQAGVECNARLRFTRNSDGQPLTTEELAVVHTEKLHLFVVDSSLKDYHHIHPRPTGQPGIFEFSFTPALTTSYQAWADFTLVKDNQNHRVKTQLQAANGRSIPPAIRVNQKVEQGGLHYEWHSEPLRQGADSMVELRITGADGKLVNDLEPVMGAFAHLVGFSADGKSLIHTHPLGAEPASQDERGSGSLRFHVAPDSSGDTQFYLQIKRAGQEEFIPFGQRIKTPDLMVQKMAARQQHSHGMLHAI